MSGMIARIRRWLSDLRWWFGVARAKHKRHTPKTDYPANPVDAARMGGNQPTAYRKGWSK